MSQLRLIRASAGSGKTFTITAAYLRLLFRYTANYKHILAVTFTNKATAEMKGRILKELFLIAVNDEKHKSKHAPSLCLDLGLSETELQKKSREILDTILHNYSRFTVTTIDSFFQRIIKAFAREAGLQSNFNVELNTDVLLEKATNSLLAKLNNDPLLLEWLTEFSENLIEDGSNWDFKGKIADLGKQLFNEKFSSLPDGFRKDIANRELLKQLNSELFALQEKFAVQIKKNADDAMAIFEKNGIHPNDFKGLSRGDRGVY